MKKKLVTVLSSTLFLSTAFAHNAFAIDMRDALVSSYKTNPTLHAERENLQATDELMSQAVAGWFPSASFTVEQGRESIHAEGSRERTDTNHTRRLNLEQPIFNGGQTISQMKRAKHLVQSGQANLERVEQSVLLDSITAYMNLYQAQEVEKYSKNNIDVLNKHLEFANNRFSLGEVTRTDVAQTQSRLARGYADYNRAQGDLASARAAFKRVIGIEPDNTVLPTDIVDLPATLEEAIALSQKNNPQVRSTTFDVKAAKDAVNISKSSLLPDVSLRAELRKSNGFVNLGGGEYDTQTALVNVTVPLYQSGAEYSRIRANKDNEEKRIYDARAAADNVTESTIRAWSSLDVARANTKATADSMAAAATALEGVTQEAEAGTRTTLDVLDAEQESFVSSVENSRAKRDEVVSIYTLKAALGQLTAASLKLPVELYNPDIHYNKTKFRPAGF